MSDVLQKLRGYFLTGGAAAVVDLGGFILLHHWGAPVFIAAAASFILATFANYFLTSHYVFRHAPSFRGYAAFFVAALLGLLTNVAVTTALVGLDVHPTVAKLSGIGAAFFLNFAINYAVVFRNNQSKQADTRSREQ